MALSDVLPIGSRPGLYVTMARGQWDELLAAAYATGCTLVELDESEEPVKAFRVGGDL